MICRIDGVLIEMVPVALRFPSLLNPRREAGGLGSRLLISESSAEISSSWLR